MRLAGEFFVGEHDFSAFRSAECQAKSPVRRVIRLDIECSGERIDFLISANAFLHHMVRNLIGTFLLAGKGTLTLEDVRGILQARSRAGNPGAPAPASGLYLVTVEY